MIKYLAFINVDFMSGYKHDFLSYYDVQSVVSRRCSPFIFRKKIFLQLLKLPMYQGRYSDASSLRKCAADINGSHELDFTDKTYYVFLHPRGS